MRHSTPLRMAVVTAAVMSWPGPAAAQVVALQNATATRSQVNYFVGTTIDGVITGNVGWAIDNGQGTSPETAVFETVTDVSFATGADLTFTLHQSMTSDPTHTLGRFRLSFTTDPRPTFADGLASGGDVTA